MFDLRQQPGEDLRHWSERIGVQLDVMGVEIPYGTIDSLCRVAGKGAEMLTHLTLNNRRDPVKHSQWLLAHRIVSAFMVFLCSALVVAAIFTYQADHVVYSSIFLLFLNLLTPVVHTHFNERSPYGQLP